MKREYPSFLDRKCVNFVGRALLIRPMGLRYYIDRQEQELDPSAAVQTSDMTVIPQSFFEQDGEVTGFVGEVRTAGHPLDRFQAVLSTLSDGQHFIFSDNLCPIWKARFGDSEPKDGPEGMPEFGNGRVFRGPVVVFEQEVYLQRCLEHLDKMDPRRGTHG